MLSHKKKRQLPASDAASPLFLTPRSDEGAPPGAPGQAPREQQLGRRAHPAAGLAVSSSGGGGEGRLADDGGGFRFAFAAPLARAAPRGRLGRRPAALLPVRVDVEPVHH